MIITSRFNPFYTKIPIEIIDDASIEKENGSMQLSSDENLELSPLAHWQGDVSILHPERPRIRKG